MFDEESEAAALSLSTAIPADFCFWFISPLTSYSDIYGLSNGHEGFYWEEFSADLEHIFGQGDKCSGLHLIAV